MDKQFESLKGATQPRLNPRQKALRITAIAIAFLVLSGFLLKIVLF